MLPPLSWRPRQRKLLLGSAAGPGQDPAPLRAKVDPPKPPPLHRRKLAGETETSLGPPAQLVIKQEVAQNPKLRRRHLVHGFVRNYPLCRTRRRRQMTE